MLILCMKKQIKKNYEAPQLTVVAIKTERGYAGSVPFAIGLFSVDDAPEESGMQDYTMQSGDFWL